MNLLSTAIELSVGFIALLVLLKILGKSTFSQLTPFDFISALILGDLIGNAIYEDEANIGWILFAIAVWGTLILLIEWCTQKFRWTRGALEGKPSILIRDGQIERQEMKKNKIDMNQMLQLLRKEKVFSLREVAYAILESDGTMSVLKKTKYEMPTISDMNLPLKPVYLPVTLINDGQVDWENLSKSGHSEEWLLNHLQKHNIDRYKDIFYFEWKKDEGVYLEKM
ncbi:DUF421 domain-containing protein [Salicibibacter cibarius]|uniref:DUF421 domain-containing protein n=1 Tax=Salicibibacter cibarius TaxID=2743000 RepID=A0A7T6Z392_9BACI|nr:DUF421 domain-containing protein [Salicibibacter cibarius]QQK76170.1 DUF421 domain-containing protein [Salicibibacter cibarius]